MATKNNTTDSTVKTRTGSIVTLIALLLPLIIALVAFSVDYGIIVVAKHELQNAADAAATATLETLNIDQKSADLAAFETITANHLLGTQLDFNMDLDIHYGTWDDEAREFTVIERTSTPSSPTDVSGSSIPNGATAVRVRLTRSRARSNGVRLFFAPVIGTNFAEVEAEAIAARTPGCNGFFGIDFVEVRNQAKTDSYNSDEGDYDAGWGYNDSSANRRENGDTCSNGKVNLRSGAEVHGNAAGSSVTAASGTLISGTSASTSSNRTFDPVNFDEANINDNESIPEPPQYSYPPEFLSADGDLVINNGRNVTLESGVYSVRDLKVAGGSRLSINGEVTIYVERELRLDNGTFSNTDGSHNLPSDFQLLVGSGPVTLAGGQQLHGVIYAPEAAVTINNNAEFFGSIVGKSLTLAGNAKLHLDEALLDDEDSSGPSRLVK